MTCPCSGSTPPAAALKTAAGSKAVMEASTVGPLGKPGYTWNGPQGRKPAKPAA